MGSDIWGVGCGFTCGLLDVFWMRAQHDYRAMDANRPGEVHVSGGRRFPFRVTVFWFQGLGFIQSGTEHSRLGMQTMPSGDVVLRFEAL